MSGLCGWLSTAGIADGNILTRMAAPLSRFDASPVHCRSGTHCGAAIAARPGRSHVWQGDGLLVAIWGDVTLAGAATPSDPAAALARLWRQLGPQACADVSGLFALCILDEQAGEALLAVDRCASLGLLYQCDTSGVVFASSADALLAHPAADARVDPQAIYNYLYFHMVPGPRGVYAQQQRLLPGEYLHYRRGTGVRGAYWRMRFQEQLGLPFGQLKVEFLATLRRAVRSSLGDGAVGAFLSGGTDSSTLAGILAETRGGVAHTYSIGFDAPGYDEMAYARLAAQHFGAEHHTMYVTAAHVVEAVPRIAALFDQPFGNASAVPSYYCAQLARADGIERLLGGDGGDELFGGNERYARQAVFARYGCLPPAVRRMLARVLLSGMAGRMPGRLLAKGRRYIEQASVPLPARLESYNLLQAYGAGAVLETDFLAQLDPADPQVRLAHAYELSRGHSQINRLLALDLQFTLADNDLPKVVKACELAGVEAAFPFLDDAMLAFSARLASGDKLKGTRLRYFFKQALRDFLPRAILDKQKHGFGLPFGLWLQQHAGLRALAYDSLSDLKARRIVRAGFIDTLLSRHVAEHAAYHGTMVWVLMMLEQWHQQRGR